MPNYARYLKNLGDMKGRQFNETLKMVNKMQPEWQKMAPGEMVPKDQIVPERDMPFKVRDRVQVISGPNKGKVGTIVSRLDNSNSFYVAGIGSRKMLAPIEFKPVGEDAEQFQPVFDGYQKIIYTNMRLVGRMRTEDNKEEDVAFHSIRLGPEYYDARSNSYPRRRFAAHDSSYEIPFRLDKVEPLASPLTTPATQAELRTHYVTSALECPLDIYAVGQITNPNARFKRSRYAKGLTEKDIKSKEPPAMPIPPKTRKLLEALKTLPKPPKVKWTSEMEEFVGSEIKSGLHKRLDQEQAARASYK